MYPFTAHLFVFTPNQGCGLCWSLSQWSAGMREGYTLFTLTLTPGSHSEPVDLVCIFLDCGRSLAKNRFQNILEMLKMFQSMVLSSVRNQIILRLIVSQVWLLHGLLYLPSLVSFVQRLIYLISDSADFLAHILKPHFISFKDLCC